MTAAEVLSGFRRRGVKLWPAGDRLRYAAPEGLLTAADLAALAEVKMAVLELLKDELAALPAVRLGALNRVLEVAVPWAELPLLFVPGCRLAERLRATEARPGRVWCTCELRELLLTGLEPLEARLVAEAKVALDGRVAAVARGSEASQQGASATGGCTATPEPASSSLGGRRASGSPGARLPSSRRLTDVNGLAWLGQARTRLHLKRRRGT